MGNIQAVDKRNIANGIVRISFETPEIDIAILGDIVSNPRVIENFVYTVENVKDTILPPTKCTDATHEKKLSCVCQGPSFSHQYCRTTDCPFSVIGEDMCVFCCYRVLESYSFEDACKIVESWKTTLDVSTNKYLLLLCFLNFISK